MKQILGIGLLLLIGTSTDAYGDGLCDKAQAVTLGPELGLGLTRIGSKDIQDITNSLGWVVGISTSIRLYQTTLFLSPRLLYVKKGAGIFAGISSLKYRYIEAPIAAKLVTRPCARLKPYVQVGFGIGYLLSAKNNSTDVKNGAESWEVGAIVGGGVLLRTSPTWILDLAINYEHGLSDVSSIEREEIRNRTLFLTLSAQWGHSGDRDGDGISGDEDRCPDEAEDRDGFEDGDGCPDPDNDGDGILDGRDACPDEAEDRDGWQDEDGCPDPDDGSASP